MSNTTAEPQTSSVPSRRARQALDVVGDATVACLAVGGLLTARPGVVAAAAVVAMLRGVLRVALTSRSAAAWQDKAQADGDERSLAAAQVFMSLRHASLCALFVAAGVCLMLPGTLAATAVAVCQVAWFTLLVLVAATRRR